MLKKLSLILLIAMSIISFKNFNVYGKDNPVKIYDKTIIKENQYIKVNAKLPIIKIEGNNFGEKLTEKINGRFEGTLVDVTSLAELASEKDKEALGKYEVNAIYDQVYNQNNILSLYTINYQFTGGAHGMTTLVPYNINIIDGRELSLSTIFKKDFNYKEFINKKVDEKIAENKDMYFTDEESKFKTISDNQDFYINDKGLVVVFPLYDIAPYASGIQQVLIPKEEIAKQMLINIW